MRVQARFDVQMSDKKQGKNINPQSVDGPDSDVCK
jgi:hypothetical protein